MINVKITKIKAVSNLLRSVADELQDRQWERKTLNEAAQFVIPFARQRNPDARKAHYYYRGNTGYNVTRKRWFEDSTGEFGGGQQFGLRKGRKRGKGTVPPSDKILIQPGNLDKSIGVLNLPKAKSAYVGPVWVKPERNPYGRGAKRTITSIDGNGFYAAMSQKSYRNSNDFRKNVMEPALAQAAAAITRYISLAIKRRVAQAEKQRKTAPK